MQICFPQVKALFQISLKQFLWENCTDKLAFGQFPDWHFLIDRTQTDTSPKDSSSMDIYPTGHFPDRNFSEHIPYDISMTGHSRKHMF